jgi:hypothetical protein
MRDEQTAEAFVVVVVGGGRSSSSDGSTNQSVRSRSSVCRRRSSASVFQRIADALATISCGLSNYLARLREARLVSCELDALSALLGFMRTSVDASK